MPENIRLWQLLAKPAPARVGGWACCDRRQFQQDAFHDRQSAGAASRRQRQRLQPPLPQLRPYRESNPYSYGYGDSDVNADSDPDGYGNSYGHAYTVCVLILLEHEFGRRLRLG